MTDAELLQQAETAQRQAAELFRARRDEEAHPLNRDAAAKLLVVFHRSFAGEILMQLLAGLRSLAISSFTTGRTAEGLTALGTAMSYAEVGLKRWPDVPPLLEEHTILKDLEAKVGGHLTSLVAETYPDNWRWPFED